MTEFDRFRDAMIRYAYPEAIKSNPAWVEEEIAMEWEWVSQHKGMELADKLAAVLSA